MRPSRAAYQSMISVVRSVEPSSTIINSKSVWVWCSTLSIASAKYCSALYTAMMTETEGKGYDWGVCDESVARLIGSGGSRQPQGPRSRTLSALYAPLPPHSNGSDDIASRPQCLT